MGARPESGPLASKGFHRTGRACRAERLPNPVVQPHVAQGGKRLRMTLGGGAILGGSLAVAYLIAVILSNVLR